MDTGTTTTVETVDLTPVLNKMDNLIGLVYIENMFLFAILIFMAFKLALKGLWK